MVRRMRAGGSERRQDAGFHNRCDMEGMVIMKKEALLKQTSRIVAVCVLLFAVVAAYYSSQLSFGKWSQPGPGFVPILVSVLMGVLSIADVVMEFRKDAVAPEEFANINWIRFFLFSALCLIYVVLQKQIGFLLDTVICLFLMIKVAGIKGWIKPVLVSVLFSAFVWYVFTQLLKVPLPSAAWL